MNMYIFKYTVRNYGDALVSYPPTQYQKAKDDFSDMMYMKILILNFTRLLNILYILVTTIKYQADQNSYFFLKISSQVCQNSEGSFFSLAFKSPFKCSSPSFPVFKPYL